MIPLYILLGLTLAAVAYIAWKIQQSNQDGDPRLKAELDRRVQEIGELKNQMAELKSEKDTQSGKGKELFNQFKNLEADYKAATKEAESLRSQIAKFEAQFEKREKDQSEALSRMEAAKIALDDERNRIRKEDDERQEKRETERDRLWAEHENTVVSLLTDLCKKPQISFTSYDNTNLPEGFHGSLKPDFLIEFLNQYVIFDAKVSKASNLQTYVNDQVKKTAKKVKGNEEIYPTIFLVIPNEAVKELKSTSYYEEGFTFFVITPEALEPVLSSLKRIQDYDLAEQIDPMERENIVDLVAQFHNHISSRNAAELLIMKHGLETLSHAERTNPQLVADAIVKKAKMRSLNINTAEFKQLSANPSEVADELEAIQKPKPKIKQEEIDVLRANQ